MDTADPTCLCSARPVEGAAQEVSGLLRLICRAGAPVASLALALALVAPVSAAEPAGVVFDATVAVVVVDPDGVPVPDADLILEARLTDFPEDPPVAVLRTTTDAAGEATFDGVPRGVADGPTVHLSIDAHRERETTDEDGCRTVESWSGNVVDLVSPPSDPVVITANVASSLVCRTIAGRIVDASGVVHPADPSLSRISIELPDGGGAMAFPLVLDADGTFRQRLPAWGSFDAPAVVTVVFVSQAAKIAEADCVRTVAELVRWREPLALETDDAPFLELVTAPVEGGTCGSVSVTPPPAAPAPTPALTLPPTDIAEPGSARPAPASGALVGVGLLVVTCGLVMGGAARSRRRR
jgi:hypothetical protein